MWITLMTCYNDYIIVNCFAVLHSKVIINKLFWIHYFIKRTQKNILRTKVVDNIKFGAIRDSIIRYAAQYEINFDIYINRLAFVYGSANVYAGYQGKE